MMRISRGVLLDWCLYEGAYPLGEAMRRDLRIILKSYLNK